MKKNILNFTLVSLVFTCLTLLSHFLINHLGNISIINTAHAAAAATHTLHESLLASSAGAASTEWVFNVWKVAMGLANIFVAIILFFFAFVNIAHISYDTYQLKKTLPKLITGIIMANFSMVICRMLVDIATVLSRTFTQNTKLMMEGILCSLTFTPQTSAEGLVTTIVTPVVLVYFAGPLLIFFIVLLLVILLGILWLGLLMFIRRNVIFILAAVAPVAFILLAFPPTESYFKKWWEWFVSWVFMGPIMVMLLWMAGMVGGKCGDAFSLAKTITTLTLVYFACIVPFKFGGVIMGGIGKASKFATTGNPYSKRKLALAQAKASKMWGNTRLGKYMGRGRAADEMGLATLQAEQKAQAQMREKEVREKLGSKQGLREKEITHAEGELKKVKQAQDLEIEEGKFNHISKRQMKAITGSDDHLEVALKYVNQANELKTQEDALTKRRDIDLQTICIRDARKDVDLRNEMDLLDLAGEKVQTDYTETGEKIAAGAPRHETTWSRSIEVAEEIRSKAKGETDLKKRGELETAAQHFDNKAAEFAASHSDYASLNTNVQAGASKKTKQLNRDITRYNTEATTREALASALNLSADEDEVAGNIAEAAQKRTEAAEFTKKANTLRERGQKKEDEVYKITKNAAIFDENAKVKGKKIDYQRYLGRNASGRRQKNLNPSLMDEVKTQVMTSKHTDLVGDTNSDTETFGTSEWRARKSDYDKALNGNLDEVDGTAAYACQVQLRSTHEVMTTARRGDAKGLEVMEQFTQRVQKAGRTDFKKDMTIKALDTMDPTSKAAFKAEIIKQFAASPAGATHRAAIAAMGLNPDAKQLNDYYDKVNANNPDEIEKANDSIDFSKMDITSRTGRAGATATANKAFIDRFLNQIELDNKLGLSKSPGSMLKK